MSKEVFGDEGEGAAHGSETAFYASLSEIHQRYNVWLATAQNGHDFWSPEDEKLAIEIDGLFDKLRDQMNVPL